MGGKRARLLAVLGVLAVVAPIAATYAIGKTKVETVGEATLLVAGGRTFERTSNGDASFQGVLTVLDNGCVGIRESSRSFVAVWPRGTVATDSPTGLQVGGISEGGRANYSRRVLTQIESWSLPSKCDGYPALGLLEVEAVP